MRTAFRLACRTVSAGSLVLSLPLAAWACPVCGLGTGDNTWAYGAMSVMLSALPLGMICGGSFWLYRRARRFDDQE